MPSGKRRKKARVALDDPLSQVQRLSGKTVLAQGPSPLVPWSYVSESEDVTTYSNLTVFNYLKNTPLNLSRD